MRIVEYSEKYFEECSELYMNVFNRAPWNDNWSLEKIKQRFLSIINMPTFKGYLYLHEERLFAACLGHLNIWWKYKEYFIDEMFVNPSIQRSGHGSELLNYIADALKKAEIESIVLLTGRKYYSKDFYMKNGMKILNDIIFMKKTL